MRRLLAITSVMALAVFGVVLVLMLWVNPLIAVQKDAGLSQNNLLETLQPGRFQVLNGGRRVVYVERISRDRELAKNLFLAEEKKSAVDAGNTSPWIVLSATRGYQTKDPLTHESFMVSTDGYRYEGTPGSNEYKVIQFKKYSVRMPTNAANSARQELEAIPTKQLWQDYNKSPDAAELQWRLSIPFSVFVLMLMAVPLSRVRPRQGRYSHLFPALLIYIIYVNLLLVARNWVELKMVPIYFGMWWVHCLMLGVAGVLLLIQSDAHRRFFSRLRRAT
jgi:lipopolysaccharide export system permease protein